MIRPASTGPIPGISLSSFSVALLTSSFALAVAVGKGGAGVDVDLTTGVGLGNGQAVALGLAKSLCTLSGWKKASNGSTGARFFDDSDRASIRP